MRGASIWHLALGLWRRDFFTVRDVSSMAWKQLRFAALGESLEHVEQIREQALGFIAGHSVAEIGAIGEEIFDEAMHDKIWPGTQALTRMHLDEGQEVWLVTATPVEVAQVIADRLGLTGALGTVAESVDGIYTGRLSGEPLHGAAKADRDRGAGRRARLRPEPLRGLLRLGQRHPDALARRATPARSTPTAPCATTPGRNGWTIRDYRTGRRAAKVGVQAVGATALAGALAAAAARRRSR